MLNLAPLLLLACGPKQPVQTAAAVDPHVTQPAPLAPRPFQIPQAHEGKLSNGVSVFVVENHEAPLVFVRVAFDTGGWTDPADLPGLADVTLDMLNEGAAGQSAAQLSTALRTLGTSLSTAAGTDGSALAFTAMAKNLEPSLDLAADILLHPDFPQADWELMRKKRLQDLQAARDDAGAMASRVQRHLMYGDQYRGHLDTEAAYQAMTVDDMKSWYASNLVPAHAIVLVGGDTTLEQVLPLLDARLGAWTATRLIEEQARPQASALPPHEAATIYLVDKPGATQSMIRAGQFVGQRTDADWTAFQVANRVIGGQFTARINMNLREDKGWTYGARCGAQNNYLPDLWTCSASVVADSTAPAVSEVLRELRESLDARPIQQAELDAAKSGWLGTWPLSFEQPGYLLDQTKEVRRYGLPADWIASFPDRVRAVDLAAAQAAWDAHVHPDKLQIVVVGDAEQVGPSLEELGMPVVRLDADGAVLE